MRRVRATALAVDSALPLLPVWLKYEPRAFTQLRAAYTDIRLLGKSVAATEGKSLMKRLILAATSLVVAVLAVIGSQRGGDDDKPVGTRVPVAFGPIHPRLSPDGAGIAFSYLGSIWTMPRTGGTMTRLTDGEGFDVDPVWSPDGKRIAYFNSPNLYGGDLRLIHAN